MRPPLCALVLASLLLTGCTTGGRPSLLTNPLGWWTQRGERAVERAQAAATRADADLLLVAQRNVEEFMAALRLAPPSRPVAVAAEAGAQAARHLTQLRGPLPPEQLAQIEARAAALTSEDPATRAPAEAALAAQRRDDAQTARLAAGYRAQLAATRDHAAAIARDNAEWAARYLRLQLAAAAGAVFTVLITVAGIAWRLNLGGLQTGVAEAVGNLRAKYGDKDEDVLAVLHSLDAPTRPSVQRQVATLAEQALLAALKAQRPQPPAAPVV